MACSTDCDRISRADLKSFGLQSKTKNYASVITIPQLILPPFFLISWARLPSWAVSRNSSSEIDWRNLNLGETGETNWEFHDKSDNTCPFYWRTPEIAKLIPLSSIFWTRGSRFRSLWSISSHSVPQNIHECISMIICFGTVFLGKSDSHLLQCSLNKKWARWNFYLWLSHICQ